MIVEMEQMKEKTVIQNIRLVQLQNLPVKTSNVFETNTDVTEKMTAVITQMKLAAVR